MSAKAVENSHDTRLERLQEILDSGTLQHAGRMLNALQPGEIAHLLEALPLAER
jgi:magnesium transporter